MNSGQIQSATEVFYQCGGKCDEMNISLLTDDSNYFRDVVM